MMDTDDQWTRALACNNVRAILRWLRNLLAEVGDADVENSLASFSSWVQRMAEVSKELLTQSFSRCQGLWMFLDHSCFTSVQRLRNLLTLAQWGRRHGLGIPCVVCRVDCGSSAVRQDCWNRERRALKQPICLGRLVQWWGITGLLPKYPGKDAYANLTHTVKLYKPVTLYITELLLLCNYSYKYSVTRVALLWLGL
nr:uncharacterized protein LOC112070132 [Salvelinus alpinus]